MVFPVLLGFLKSTLMELRGINGVRQGIGGVLLYYKSEVLLMFNRNVCD